MALINLRREGDAGIHVVKASDGQEQPHAHVVLTMCRLGPEGFSSTKERDWNRLFQEDKGKVQRAAIASRMNEWTAYNRLDVTVDHRRKAERGDDTPVERNVPRASWEAFKRRPDSAAAAPARQVLEGRQLRRQLRQAKAAAVYCEAAARVIGGELDSRRPGLRTPARKSGFAWDARWSPKLEGYVTGVEINDRFAAINLSWGGSIQDFGNRIIVTGKADWRAAMALADHAARKGLKAVEITGSDPKFRAALAAQLAARGIDVTNERQPSAYAIAQAKELSARASKPQPVPVSEPVRPEPPKPRPRQPEPEPMTGPKAAPGYVPPWAQDPGWTAKKNNSGGRA